MPSTGDAVITEELESMGEALVGGGAECCEPLPDMGTKSDTCGLREDVYWSLLLSKNDIGFNEVT